MEEFPTTPVLDDFNRADGGLGANWTTDAFNTGADALRIVSNEVKGSVANDLGNEYYSAIIFNADSEVYITLKTLGTPTTELFLYLRIVDPVTANADGYGAQFLHVSGASNDTVRFQRLDNTVGTWLTSAQTLATDLSNGDRLGFSAIGDTLKAHHDTGTWNEEDSVTDTTYTAGGYLGFWNWNSTSTNTTWDNFGGGNWVRPGAFTLGVTETASILPIVELNETVGVGELSNLALLTQTLLADTYPIGLIEVSEADAGGPVPQSVLEPVGITEPSTVLVKVDVGL